MIVKNSKYKIKYIGSVEKNLNSFFAFVTSLNEAKAMGKGYWQVKSEELENILKIIDSSELDYSLICDENDIGSELKLQLFPYQKDVVKYCLNTKNAIIVLPCGSGKTPIGIDIFVDLRKNKEIGEKDKGLIVVKSSLKVQWIKEVEKFSHLKASAVNTYKSMCSSHLKKIKKIDNEIEVLLKDARYNGMKIMELQKLKDKISKQAEEDFNKMFSDEYDLFITNYETLRDDEVKKALHKLGLKYVFADEVHYIKNDTSSRAKALCEFANVPFKFGATATPIQKNPLDAYSISKFISPSTFKSKSAFSSCYLTYSGFGRISGSKNESDLNKRLSNYMIVKDKEEVSSQLPSLVPITRYCKLTEKQEKITEQLMEEIKELKEQEASLIKKAVVHNSIDNLPASVNAELIKIQANIMARQTFASELATCEELLINSESDMAKNYVTNSQSSKIELLLDLLEEIFDSGEKAIIFSKYQKLQKILEREIVSRFKDIKCAFVNGSLSSEERYDEVYNKFRDKENYKVLIMSDAGAEGINASKAKYLIEIEPADSYLIQTQRRGRIERADSIHDTVFVYQLVAEKSYDEVGLKIIAKKERYDAQIIKGNV